MILYRSWLQLHSINKEPTSCILCTCELQLEPLMHLINQYDTWFWELQVNCNTTTTSHHIISRLVQPSNQSTCFHRKTSATTTSCPFWLDRPDSFFTFTSTACAFRKQRITVTIPFTTLSNYLTPFWTNFSTSFNNLFGRNINITFYFMFHGLSGTVSIDRALSRRLNNIHHTSVRVFWTYYWFYDEYVGLGT